MTGKGWCGQVLKVEDAKVSSNQLFILPLFSGVAGNGSFTGRVGLEERVGQEQLPGIVPSGLAVFYKVIMN